MPAIAGAQPDAHIDRIRYHDLMGTWSCHGTDRTGAAFATTLQWGFNDGGDFYFLDQPHPVTPLHAVISETWFFDTSAGADLWRTTPDPGSFDPASWTSAGMSNGAMTFIRQAAQSTLSRTFRLTAPNRLTLTQQQGAAHPVFALTCVRTVNDAPR